MAVLQMTLLVKTYDDELIGHILWHIMKSKISCSTQLVDNNVDTNVRAVTSKIEIAQPVLYEREGGVPGISGIDGGTIT